MSLVENYGFAITGGFLIFLFLKISKNSLQRTKNIMEHQEQKPESLWILIKLVFYILKWYADKRPTKRPIFEEIYYGDNLKEIWPIGRPKSIKLFNMTLVINDDIESIQDVLNSGDLSGRQPDNLSEIITQGRCKGIVWSHGPIWKELSKFSFNKLNKLGFSKNDKLSQTLSDILPDMLSHVKDLKETTGNKILVTKMFPPDVINIVWSIIGGYRFTKDDKKFLRFRGHVNAFLGFQPLKLYFLASLPDYTFIRQIVLRLKPFKSFKDAITGIHDFAKAFIEEKSKGKPDTEDFVGHFLLEIEKNKYNNELNNIYCKDQLVVVISDLILAGVELVNNYLEMCIMHMILHPLMQEKVQQEIDSVIGNNLPCFSRDRRKMPYTCAVLMEAHRMGFIFPVLPRYLQKDIVIKDKLLKKGTYVLNLMWPLRMNAEYWGDPTVFRPERFLNDDGTLIIEKIKRVMAYGCGNRSCAAESVASASVFTYFVAVLQKYTVTRAIGDEYLRINSFRSLSKVFPFHVSLIEREQLAPINV